MKKIIITALVIVASVLGAKAQDNKGWTIRNNSEIDPVIVCDGVVISKEKMNTIETSQIESITVLKDDGELFRKYVKNNEPGVIFITLKKSDSKTNVTTEDPKTVKIESKSSFTIRNSSDIDPVIVCDGVVISKEKMNAIDPSTIESIKVIKDDSELFRQYVKNNEPGVIFITLRK